MRLSSSSSSRDLLFSGWGPAHLNMLGMHLFLVEEAALLHDRRPRQNGGKIANKTNCPRAWRKCPSKTNSLLLSHCIKFQQMRPFHRDISGEKTTTSWVCVNKKMPKMHEMERSTCLTMEIPDDETRQVMPPFWPKKGAKKWTKRRCHPRRNQFVVVSKMGGVLGDDL